MEKIKRLSKRKEYVHIIKSTCNTYCGRMFSPRSNGWIRTDDNINCMTCLKRYERSNGSGEFSNSEKKLLKETKSREFIPDKK